MATQKELNGLMEACNAGLAAIVFQQARAAGDFAGMDSDEASDLAVAAAGNPYAALRALGHDTDGLVASPVDTYRFFMDEYYDGRFAEEHYAAEADIRAEETEAAAARLAALARFCPDGADGVMAAAAFGDDSAIRIYEEALYFA